MRLTTEQQDFASAIRDFCTRECGTREQRALLTADGAQPHNDALYRRMAELGWIGVLVPEEYGGAGGSLVDACIFLEEANRGMAPIHGIGSSLIVAGPYERFGTDEQKRSILGGIAAGAVEAIAISEPGAGSDAGSMQCRARLDGDEYVISGQKTWISDAHIAEHILLVCRTATRERRQDGLTMLQVPVDAAGLEIRQIETMGGSNVNDVFFDECRVPRANVLGAEGEAWPQLMTGLNVERLLIAAKAIGLAQRAFDDALSYVQGRNQFGQAVGSFQAIKHRIADLATEIECCRSFAYDVAAMVDDDPMRLLPRHASMAKLKCTEVCRRVALEGMQMMGGYGYAVEYDMERHVRETLVTTIVGGTSEIQREIIGRSYGL
jgi:isovaleryl-CoA dehydrogenase